uniref:Uncharacterized protein n=1 Tax=Tanacetum cinerariifolium TaxID=118510 RepID=A0A6L2KXU9_TANCI|nr:hypothetical protein [Tanacetum cinerariifolium]
MCNILKGFLIGKSKFEGLNHAKHISDRIINLQETQQVVARDEKWVPSTERVKISSTNVKLETTIPQKEETFQVVIDVIKNSTVLLDVPQILNLLNSSQEEKWQRFTREEDCINSCGRFENIIPDPDVALELGQYISLTKATEEEAVRQVHATHARIVTESVLEPTRRRPSAREEQEAADTMKALKERKKTSRRQSGTRGLSKGTGRIPKVPNESIIISATSSEGSEEDQSEDKEIDWIDSKDDDEKKDDSDDDKSIDLEMTDDEVLQGKEQVNDDKDEEMINTEVEYSGNGDAEIFDVAKAYVEKIEEIKDDPKKAELPLTSSSFSAMDKGVVDTVKDRKRKHDDDDDEDPSARPNQGKKIKRRRTKESEYSKKLSFTKETSKGKAPSKGSKIGKSAYAKKPVEEPITEVVDKHQTRVVIVYSN